GLQYSNAPGTTLVRLNFDSAGLAASLDQKLRAALLGGSFSLDDLLADSLRKLLDPVFTQVINPTVSTLYDDLQAAYNAQPSKTWIPAARQIVQQKIVGTGQLIDNSIRS